MDTCVIIPSEFSLILSTDVLDLFEMRVGLWSNTKINRGTEFFADQGNVRLDKLEVYGMMKENDIRREYGCVDEIEKQPDRQIRHCNWIRFLKTSSQVDKINLFVRKHADKFVYKAVRDIPANTELIAGFDKDRDLELRVTAFNETGDQADQDDSDIEVDETENSDDEDSKPLPVLVAMPTESSDQQTTPPSGRIVHHTTPRAGHPRPHHVTPESPLLSPVTPDSGRKSLSSDSLTSVSDISPNSSNSSLIGQNDHVFTPPSSRGPITTQRPAIVCVSSPFKHVPLQSNYRLFERFEDDGKSSISGEESVISTSASSAGDSTSPLRTPVKRNRERTWLPCEICGKKFDRPSLLRRHIRTHTGEKPHACDICGKAFSTSSSLNTHRRIHSGEKPHQCRVCGKRFTASSNLYYHRMTHNKEKPHKCSLCSKSFPTPGDLKSHMYVHNGSWPFRCDVCDRGFSKQTNLKNHMLLHTGDKPHECSLCGKRFALQCNLRTHLKTHESDTQEECFKCGKVYLTSQHKLSQGYCDSCHPTSPAKSDQTSNFHSISNILDTDTQHKDPGNSYYSALTSPPWSRGHMLMPLLGMSLSGRYLNPALLHMANRPEPKPAHTGSSQNYTAASVWMSNGYRV